MLANMVKRSRFFVVAPAKAGTEAGSRGQVEVGLRYYEAAAGGAVMVGQDMRHRGQVGHLEVWVGGRLDPDQARPLGEGGAQGCRRVAGQVQVAGVDAPRSGDPLEVAVGAAVDIVTDHDLLARAGQLGDGRGRRRTAGEGEAEAGAFELGHGAFEP